MSRVLDEINAMDVESLNSLEPNILDTMQLDKAVRLAKKKFKEGQPEESKSIYQDILQKFPKHKQALIALQVLAVGEKTGLQDPPTEQLQPINDLFSQGHLQLALAHTLELQKKFPNSVALFDIAGESNLGLDQYDAAIEYYQQALKIKPDFVKAYYNIGIALLHQGYLDAAINSYKQVLKIMPTFAGAHNNIGNAQKEKGDLQSAINSYKNAVLAKPDYAEAYYNMGIAQQDKGDLKAAINSYKKALKIMPNHAVAYNNMGNAQKEKGDLEAAIECFRHALEIQPNYAEAYYNMSSALQDNNDLEAAIESYRQALKIKPDYAEAHNNMGVLLNDQGDQDAAINSYINALKITPGYARAYNNMGNALMEKGDLEVAIESYKQALKIKPDYVDVWNNLTFPLQAMKLQTMAIEELLPTFNPKEDFKQFQVAKSVLNYRLHLSKENTERSLKEVCGLLSTADNKIIKNPEVSNNAERQEIIEPDKVVALVHFGRSGTGLLHSLIDNHPEISTMPSIYFSEFFNHSTWEYIISEGWSKMIDRFVANYEVLFDASVRNPIETKSKKHITYMGQKEGMANVGNQQNEVLRVDKVLFCEELCRLMKPQKHLDTFTFFWLVHLAYNKALNDRNHKHLIFYHIHNPDTYAQLNFVQAVPNANWVMMVREPIQACESWIRNGFYENKYIDVVSKIITMLFAIDNSIYHQQNSIGVRLEDLKESPSTTIPALCDWMGIEETESLYEMTAQGKKWWGDPGSPDFEKDGMEPFGKTSIERTLGSIFTEQDQFILRTLFHPFRVRFGYVENNLEQFKEDLKTIRPMLDDMFDFEVKMAQRMHKDAEQFMKSGYYSYLRSGLIDRWNVLTEHHTYPNMIKPLEINQRN